jgi:hypothetical protein
VPGEKINSCSMFFAAGLFYFAGINTIQNLHLDFIIPIFLSPTKAGKWFTYNYLIGCFLFIL